MTFLNSYCAKKERKCPQEGEGKDVWSGSEETFLEEPAFPSGPSLSSRENVFL